MLIISSKHILHLVSVSRGLTHCAFTTYGMQRWFSEWLEDEIFCQLLDQHGTRPKFEVFLALFLVAKSSNVTRIVTRIATPWYFTSVIWRICEVSSRLAYWLSKVCWAKKYKKARNCKHVSTDEMGWSNQKTWGWPMVQKCKRQSVVERTWKKNFNSIGLSYL